MQKRLLFNSLGGEQGLCWPAVYIIKVIIKKDKFYFENSGGQDTQGEGEDTPGKFAPRGASCPRESSPPGGKINWYTGGIA